MTTPIGHFSEHDGKHQSWLAHTRGVIARMLRFLLRDKPNIPMRGTCCCVGGGHDFGKLSLRYQVGRRSDFIYNTDTYSFAHQSQGLFAAMNNNLKEQVFYPIAAHHRGFYSGNTWVNDFYKVAHLRTNDIMSCHWEDCFKEACAIEPNLLDYIREAQEEQLLMPTNCHDMSAIIRYISSCLVDADCLDTEMFFDPKAAASRMMYERPDWGKLFCLLDSYRKSKSVLFANSPVTDLRNIVFERSVAAGSSPVGFHLMPYPTGVGKTMAQLGWALRHAETHKKNRVIIVVPFIKIAIQTANEIRNAFGDNVALLEDHSGIDFEVYSNPEEKETELIRSKQLRENWEAPIIVTTMAQCLDSLHARHGGRFRKLHNFANSVVVFDESQDIPANLLNVTFETLSAWQRIFNTSYLLSSATLPDYSRYVSCSYVDPRFREVFSAPEIRRANVIFPKSVSDTLSYEEICEKILKCESKEQTLCITNTRCESYEMYLKMLEKTGTTDGLFLLNTFLAKKHQEKILEEIRLRLKTNQRCLVFSTSLVEAGVDLDFPTVFRFFGSLRSLVQALGRANRHGFLSFGRMFVVIPDDGIKIFSGTLLLELNATLTLLNSYNWNIDVYDPVFLEKFFSMFLTQVDLCQDKSPEISKFIETYDYEKVGDLYRVVDEESSQVLVPYGAGKKYIGQLQSGIKPDRKFMKKIEMYQVGVNISNSNEKIKHIKSVSDVLYWDGPYNNELGINDIVFPRS